MTQLPKLRIFNDEIDYTVKRVYETKYVYLTFNRNFKLKIAIPKDSNIDPEVIIRKKRDWINKKYRQLKERRKVFDGKHVLFKGKNYELGVLPSDKASVKIQNGKIILMTDAIDPKILLKEWMTRKTKGYLDRVIPIYAKKLGITVNGFQVKDTKRWGYCNRNGQLYFNWQIIALPRELAEYVILHEITHLSEFSHSKIFRYRIASLCPDFMEREIMLKNIIALSDH